MVDKLTEDFLALCLLFWFLCEERCVIFKKNLYKMLLFLYFNKVDLNIFLNSSITTYFIMILKRYLNLVSSAETNNDLLLLENIVLGIQISELKSIGSLKHWQFTNTTYKSHLVHNLTIKISSFQRLWSIEIDWKETVKIAWTRNTYYYKCYVNFLYNYFFFQIFNRFFVLLQYWGQAFLTTWRNICPPTMRILDTPLR